MKGFGRCHAFIVLLILLIIGIDESEEVVVEFVERDGDTLSNTTTVDVTNPADCNNVFSINVTETGTFNLSIATGNTDDAFIIDFDTVIPTLQCNMTTIRTNGETSYSLSINVTDDVDSTLDTKTVTVTVVNLVITNIESSCSSDADCQITLHTPPYVCDNSMCKFGVKGGNCTAIANSCLTNGQCTSDACECVDGFDPDDNKCYELELSSPSNGSIIEICESTEINEVIANLSASFAPTSTEFVFNITDPSNTFTTAEATIIVVSDLDVDVETPVISYVLIIELMHPNSSRTVSTTITISVADDNDNTPKFDNSSYTFDISEKSTASTVVGTIFATDKDSTSPNNMIANYTVIGTNAFEITSDGVLRVSSGASLNYTTTPIDTFLVTATDGAGEDTELSTNVSVSVNIRPDIGSLCSTDDNCAEILFPDPPFVCDDSECKLGVGGNCTSISNSCLTNGQCTSDACECVDGFDPVDNKCYELILSSPSNGSVIEICESTEINEVIANLSASFAPTSTEFVFNITDPSNTFTTAEATIIVVSDLDVVVETPVTSYVLIIELMHPNSSRTVSTTITISVADDNDNTPKYDNSSYTFDISEKSTASTVVGTIFATDKDSTSPNNMIANYTVIGTNAFEITSDGVLRVSSGASLNYTTTPIDTFLVMATDGAGEDMELSTNVSVSVNIRPDIGSLCSTDDNCAEILFPDPPFVCDDSECKLGS
ncbi:protocadherin Fat 1-like [Mya arenaria]|uniref:protocadherin Fat 1-like n=1 Tax=Mya arenaria TaxID=6604 RepID=UPI0022E6F755|nr:protocadherin Fat 1-like [Mya arenaria]